MIKLILFIISLLFTTVSFAEPNTTVKYLMNEPLSLFDMGIYKLSDRLSVIIERFSNAFFINEHPLTGLETHTFAEYDVDKNRIELIVYTTLHQPNISVDQMKEFANAVFKNIRESFGTEPKTGKAQTFQNHSVLNKFFMHKGYRNPKEPKSLLDDINNITDINVTIVNPKHDPFLVLKCTGALYGTEIFYSK